MVFKAEDPQLERAIALKIMLPQIAENETARDRFLREARAAAKLEHDHVIAIYQLGQDRGIPFIAMPFLKGMSLEDSASGEDRPCSRCRRSSASAGRSPAAVQARPTNGGSPFTATSSRRILPGLRRAATNGRIKILDFGLARPEKEDAGPTRSGR